MNQRQHDNDNDEEDGEEEEVTRYRALCENKPKRVPWESGQYRLETPPQPFRTLPRCRMMRVQSTPSCTFSRTQGLNQFLSAQPTKKANIKSVASAGPMEAA